MINWLSSFLEETAEHSETLGLQLEASNSVFIYGTGTFAHDILQALHKKRVKISGFIDHRIKENQYIEDYKIYHPEDTEIEKDKAIVLISIHNREADILKIKALLEYLGYKKIIGIIELYDEFTNDLGTRYWLTSRTYYSSHAKEIQSVYDLLSDEKGRATFESLIRFRISGDYSLLPEPDMEHQYFPPDLPTWPQPIRFVDCGAYDGDTLHSLLNAGHKFEAITAFEPDQDNFRKLSEYVIQNREKLPDTSLFPCGVYSSTTQLTFDTGKGEASVASETGKTTIQCVSLDECIPTFRPTLIKMDIEGAEMDALPGAHQLIKEYHPALAISAYHTPAHIWEIPLWVNQFATQNNLRYTYHYRAHAHNCFDTIFYAIPQKEQA